MVILAYILILPKSFSCPNRIVWLGCPEMLYGPNMRSPFGQGVRRYRPWQTYGRDARKCFTVPTCVVRLAKVWRYRPWQAYGRDARKCFTVPTCVVSLAKVWRYRPWQALARGPEGYVSPMWEEGIARVAMPIRPRYPLLMGVGWGCSPILHPMAYIAIMIEGSLWLYKSWRGWLSRVG